jgi:hypothetical protein
MAQKILQQSREAENALADALVRFELSSAWLGVKRDFFCRPLRRISKERQLESQANYLTIIPMRVKPQVFVPRGLTIRIEDRLT